MHCVPVVSLPVRSPGAPCGHRAAALPWAPLQPPLMCVNVQGTPYQPILSAVPWTDSLLPPSVPGDRLQLSGKPRAVRRALRSCEETHAIHCCSRAVHARLRRTQIPVRAVAVCRRAQDPRGLLCRRCAGGEAVGTGRNAV
jgi:hypothetical protein